jgi:hypothetical protein
MTNEQDESLSEALAKLPLESDMPAGFDSRYETWLQELAKKTRPTSIMQKKTKKSTFKPAYYFALAACFVLAVAFVSINGLPSSLKSNNLIAVDNDSKLSNQGVDPVEVKLSDKQLKQIDQCRNNLINDEQLQQLANQNSIETFFVLLIKSQNIYQSNCEFYKQEAIECFSKISLAKNLIENEKLMSRQCIAKK